MKRSGREDHGIWDNFRTNRGRERVVFWLHRQNENCLRKIFSPVMLSVSDGRMLELVFSLGARKF